MLTFEMCCSYGILMMDMLEIWTDVLFFVRPLKFIDDSIFSTNDVLPNALSDFDQMLLDKSKINNNILKL